MTKKSKIAIRIDSELKEQFRERCESQHSTISNELTQFIYTFVSKKP